MRQLCNIAYDAVSADVLAHGKGHLGGVIPKCLGVDDLMDMDGRDQLVGHLDAHRRDLVRDGGDAHAGGPQRQGNVVGKVGELVEPDALIQLHLVPGDRGAAGHV